MLSAIIQFVLSGAVIISSGIFLVKFADHIAETTKLGRLFVGSLFLAGATSLPELFVGLSAIKNNMPDIAIGDLFGATLMNLLILGLGDLFHKGSAKIFSRASASHALSACISIAVTSIAVIAIFLGPKLAHLNIVEFGIGPFLIIAGYLFGLRLIFFDQRVDLQLPENPQKIKTPMSLSRSMAGYLSAALVILVSAPFLSESAGKIAELSGLGNTFIGTTLVALATTFPELVSTFVSVRMGAFDLAIGNIFGSNAFNMILLAPLDLMYTGSLLASVSQIHVFTGLSSILVTSIAVMGQLYQVEKRKKFIEPDAFLVITLVIISLMALYFFRDS